MKQNLTFLMILSLFLSIPNSYAQNCEPPTNMQNPILMHAACEGSGKIVLRTIYPEVDTYQKALLDTFGVTVKAWQDSDTFHSVAAGTYDIAVRKVCQPGFSTHYTQRVTINDQTKPLNINSIRENRKDQCGNGQLQVTSVIGQAPFEYALVNSISAPNVSTNMIRDPQSSPLFSDLDAGTYYVRVYDACGEFQTQEFEIETYQDQVEIAKRGNAFLTRRNCDTFNYSVTIKDQNLFYTDNVPSINNPYHNKLWVEFPNGHKDTFENIRSHHSAQIPMAYLSETIDPNEPFPFNVEWPVVLKFGYEDDCGNITTQNLEVAHMLGNGVRMFISPHDDCDSVKFHYSFGNGNAHNQRMGPHVLMSLDNGQTWVPSRGANISATSNQFSTKLDSTYYMMLDYCGRILERTFYTGEQVRNIAATYNIATNFDVCFGMAGWHLTINSTGNFEPLAYEYFRIIGNDTINITDTVDITHTYTQSNGRNLFNLRNVEPGLYAVKLYDSVNTDCSIESTIVKDLTHEGLSPFEITTDYACDGSLMLMSNNRAHRRGLQANQPIGNMLKVEIVGHESLGVFTGVGQPDKSTHAIIPAHIMNTLPAGDYQLRVWNGFEPASEGPECSGLFMDITHTYERLKLDSSRFIRACEDDTGAIVVDVEGGEGPYTYMLYQDSIAESNLIASSQFDNIFENLSLNETYIVSVVDNCGNASNLQLSGAELGLPLFYNVVDMPCEGEQLSLNVYDLKNVQYQWYKDDIEIAGANQATFDINSITLLDEGAYKVKMIMDECEVHSNVFNLTPGDEECGVPLSDLGLEWTVKIQGQNNTLIVWEELKESIQAYTVEHSRSGKTWDAIGKVVSQEKKDVHELLHQNLSAGTHFYRIAMHDNETTYYSTVKQVNIGEGRHSITMWPNPTKDAVYLKGLTAQNELVISNVLGQELIKQSNLVEEHRVDISEFASGIYYVNIYEQGLLIQSFKVVKQ